MIINKETTAQDVIETKVFLHEIKIKTMIQLVIEIVCLQTKTKKVLQLNKNHPSKVVLPLKIDLVSKIKTMIELVTKIVCLKTKTKKFLWLTKNHLSKVVCLSKIDLVLEERQI